MSSSIRFFIANIFISVFFLSCGESVIEIGTNTYQTKIVVEAYLEVGRNVTNVRITRNFPLNTEIIPSKVFISNARVKIIDISLNKEYLLAYDSNTMYYKYFGKDLVIGYDKNYKLDISADIDNKLLQTTAETTTPKQGFSVIRRESIIDSLYYREMDENGEIKYFKIVFNPSIGTNFYALSIVALNASDKTFIYDNPFFEVTKEKLQPDKDLANYKYQLAWLQNLNSGGGKIEYKINWLDTWFYSNYRMIVYAADDNYRKFLLTHKSVQEFDGNFHEPKMNMQGDGIGVFASFIADTVYFKVKK